jgi:Mor family transcriptional regulator
MSVPDAGPPAPSADQRGYANAREILPIPILAVVQAHFDGGLLWVPPREARKDKTKGHLERNRQILKEKADGAATKVLAQKYGLSEERIRQLVRGTKSQT